MNLIIRPGGKDVVTDAIELYGQTRVVAGVFKEPTKLINLTNDEAYFARCYFEEQGKKVMEE